MIKITNGEKYFIIEESELWNRKKELKGKATKLKYSYWSIELLFIQDRKKRYKEIAKCYPNGDRYVKEYVNLDKTKNDYVLLSKEDYKEVEAIYSYMNIDQDYRKHMLIDVCSSIYSYEYYQHFILELGTEEEMSEREIYKIYVEDKYKESSIYKKEILEMAKKKLKEIYKLNVDSLGG